MELQKLKNTSYGFQETFKYKLIYVFKIDDAAHKGLLKVGEATISSDIDDKELKENCSALNKAAKERIDSYTKTAAISYDLIHTELAIREKKNTAGKLSIVAFSDHDVHNVLKNSNIERKTFPESKGREWFKVDISDVKAAIKAVKAGRKTISQTERKQVAEKILLRPEQEDAVKATIANFKDKNTMLWNAKMRFGKTLCALEVIKRSKFKKSIIITHRPVVDKGWYEDFTKIFHDDKNYEYGSKNNGVSLKDLIKSKKNFVYFASIQDLRGSTTVGGKFNKNDDTFSLDWDFVVVDEAHEGTTTALGNDVIKHILKNDKAPTKFLALSGTPFNILNEYDSNIYTWDYVMEQKSKKEWDVLHFGDANPYEGLPELRIHTYDLGNIFANKNYVEIEDKAFNFREFFRTWTGEIESDRKAIPPGSSKGDFYHKEDVKSFLDLITKSEEKSNYPFSTEKYRNLFKHTLWMVPGVGAAKALSKMLKSHPIFGSGAFNIVNVAGKGDEEEKAEEALKKVRHAIDNAGDNYTITLSCGRLTTGVTVPEWTAVFMLAGSFSTSAANYLQTIFRVQSPCNINGMTKQCCYVFDFAPDRTLKMVAEAAAVSTKAGKATSSDKAILGEFLNYCPIISIDGTAMKAYDVNKLLQQLKRAYAERAVSNGFDDTNLYNDELMKLDKLDLKEFDNLKKVVGTSKAAHKTNEIDVNNQGFTDEEYEKMERLNKKPKRQRTPEEEAVLKALAEKKKQKNDAISVLRAISIRMPLLIYGADISFDEEFELADFLKDEIVDNASWEEFMPKGVTKQIFKKFMKYYDQEIFISASRKIRSKAKAADELPPKERVEKIVELLACFKNPDKETVLTPWRVVNMHMGDCLGGYAFYDKDYKNKIDEPRFVNRGEITKRTLLNDNTKILEINSKTGVYPLYLTYSLFEKKCADYNEKALTLEVQEKLWKDVIKNNIFIICNTPMAKSITRRTLAGYKEASINAHYFKNLINMLANKSDQFINKVRKANYWDLKDVKKVNFDAVVGNPPYNENISGSNENSSLSKQLFPMFVKNAILLNADYTSLITPSRWFTADAQDKSFIKLREFAKANNHFTKIFNYPDNRLLFKEVKITGGVNYFLFDKKHNGNVLFTECYNNGETTMVSRPLFEENLDIIISMNKLVDILDKVRKHEKFIPLTEITSGRNAFGIVGKPSELNKIAYEKPFDGAIAVRCAHEKIVYVKRESITKSSELVNKWKIFTSKGNGGAGVLSDGKPVAILGKAFIGAPKSACTDSLIPIGGFDSKAEAVNLQKYMSCKFLRFMVGVLKVSQNVYQNVYQFVPMQVFTDNSDIDWSQDISQIDACLYKKYGLNNDEIAFIETAIKPISL